MKYSDIERLRDGGFISDTQQQAIVAHFKLKPESSKFLLIISVIGGVLVAAGAILLIAANWNEIPRGVKIGTGLVLMVGAHAGGWWCRRDSAYPAAAEALHLLGSLLWLGNIALVGQVYHLSERPPNALLLFWVGIAALPWLLQSLVQYVLLLLAIGVWFGMEINQPGSWIFFGSDARQLTLYALLGLIYLGSAHCLRQTTYHSFAAGTEKLGLLIFHACFYPLTWGMLYRETWGSEPTFAWVFPLMAAIALGLIGLGLLRSDSLSRQWRWFWGVTLAAAVGILACVVYGPTLEEASQFNSHHWLRWLTTCGLFVFCLLEIQVGIQQRAEYLINLGVIFIALNIFATYLNLFGSMARTGVMFLVSGIFLLLLGIFLEKKRRALLRGLKTPPAEPALARTEVSA